MQNYKKYTAMSNIEDAICHMHRKKREKQQKATDKKPYSTDEKPKY